MWPEVKTAAPLQVARLNPTPGCPYERPTGRTLYGFARRPQIGFEAEMDIESRRVRSTILAAVHRFEVGVEALLQLPASLVHALAGSATIRAQPTAADPASGYVS